MRTTSFPPRTTANRRRRVRRVGALAVVVAALVPGCANEEIEGAVGSDPSTTVDGEPESTVGGLDGFSIPTFDLGVPSEPDAVVMPLTGMPLTSVEEIPQRPALVVKVPMNDPQSFPHAGLNQTDVVFQTIINDRITRLLAVFHSQSADMVGPVRSSRLQDIDIVSALRRPALASSGGNAGVLKAVRSATERGLLYDVGQARQPDQYFRRQDRAPAPHNLFTRTDGLWGAIPDDFEVPVPIFDYLTPEQFPTGDPGEKIDIQLDSVVSHWEYDPETERYLKWHNGKPHMLEDGTQVWADNVVVMAMEYGRSTVDARSPMLHSTGAQTALVFSRNTVRTGVWYRDDPRGGWALLNNPSDQLRVPLVPGRTWVEMPRAQSGVVKYVSGGNEVLPPIEVNAAQSASKK